MKFGNIKLYNDRPSVIAEAGVNHNCNLKLAKKYIDYAKLAGADAVKFQTYKADKIVSENSPAYWDLSKEKTKSQYLLFKKYDKFNFSDYSKLYSYCKKKKITFMSTLFDVESIDKYNRFLQVYKISSSDINNIPLLRKISQKKKSVLISTGASSLKEIDFALKILKLPKNKICIMHCVLNYPTKDVDANLDFIKRLRLRYPGYLIGYSDHTIPDDNLTSLLVAYQNGAQIIEKHFTHNKKLLGNDHYHAMDKNNLINFFSLIKKINLLKKIKNNRIGQKKSIIYARRSIYFKNTLSKGSRIRSKDIIAKRPALGISVKEWDTVLKKNIRVNVQPGDLLKKSMLEK